MPLSLPGARRTCAARRGRDRPSLQRAGASGSADARTPDVLAEVVETGWIRTLGGAEVYVARCARRPGLAVHEVRAAVVAGALRVVPVVRGCIYPVPRSHVGLARAVREALDGCRLARDQGTLGVDDNELEAVGGGAPDLRRLERQGRLERRPKDDPIDPGQYLWAVPGSTPQVPEAPFARLAHHVLTWAGPATLDPLDARLAVTTASPPAATGRGVGVPGLDKLGVLRGTATPPVHPARHGLEATAFSPGIDP